MLSAETHRGNPEATAAESYGRFLYNRFRYYDPTIGRYVSADPIGQLGGPNVYAYVLNNPLNAVDPLGLLTVPGVGWVNAGESYATYATDYYAEIAGDPSSSTAEKALATIAGTAAQTWTPESSDSTARALLLALVLADALDKPVPPDDACDAKGSPKHSPNFMPPTNPPQDPPQVLPPGHTVREGPPTDGYPDGYWRQYNEHGQPVDPSTGKPPSNVSRAEFRARTHIPNPPRRGR